MFEWFSDARVPGFVLEAGNPFGIAGERRRQHLDRDIAIQRRVRRPVDFPHPAHADLGGNLVPAGADAELQRHFCVNRLDYRSFSASRRPPTGLRSLGALRGQASPRVSAPHQAKIKTSRGIESWRMTDAAWRVSLAITAIIGIVFTPSVS